MLLEIITPAVAADAPTAGFAFEWKLSLDTLLTIGSFIVFITLYISNIRASSKLLGIRLTSIEQTQSNFAKDIEQLNQLIVKMAQQDIRINNVVESLNGTGKRLDELTNRFNRYIEGRMVRAHDDQI